MTTALLAILLIYPAFYLSCVVVLYLARHPVGPLKQDDAYRPAVTMVIASAGEDAGTIRTKIENTLHLDYPPELLEIILFSDGSAFPEGVNADAFPRVQFLPMELSGKTACQNRCVAVSTGEIVLLTDITSMLAVKAVSSLVRWYVDPCVGSVGGSFEYRFTSANAEAGYLSREIRLKVQQSHYGIVTGYFGPIYSVRRSLYEPMPGFYPSDYMLPVLIIWGGHLAMLDPESRAHRTLDRNMEQELGRKRRIIAQGLAATVHFMGTRGWGMVKRIDLLAAILTRKFLRWLLAPYGLVLWLAILLVPAVFIAASAAALILLAGSRLYHASGGRNTFLLAPYYGVLIVLATLLAIFDVIRGETYAAWRPGSR
jgi:hypothetical protein